MGPGGPGPVIQAPGVGPRLRGNAPGLEGGPGAVYLSRTFLLGGTDKPVAGGARTRSVGGQLLLKPLTRPPPLESVYCWELGLASRQGFAAELQAFVSRGAFHSVL